MYWTYRKNNRNQYIWKDFLEWPIKIWDFWILFLLDMYITKTVWLDKKKFEKKALILLRLYKYVFCLESISHIEIARMGLLYIFNIILSCKISHSYLNTIRHFIFQNILSYTNMHIYYTYYKLKVFCKYNVSFRCQNPKFESWF